MCSRVRAIRSAWVSASQVSRSSGQAVSSASWLISTVPAARVSSRSAAKASSTASTSWASAGLLPSVSSALVARSAVSTPSALVAVSRVNTCRAAACWAGVRRVVGALRAAGDRTFDAAGAFVVGEGEGLPGPAAPGLVQGVRQQRQHPRAEGPGLAGAHLGQQHLDQVVIDAGVCLLGWFGDGHPQLPPGHRRDQVPVLDRVGQLRVVRAPGLEVSAHAQHDQCRRGLIRAVPAVAAACRAVMNARRCPSSGHWVNSSSNCLELAIGEAGCVHQHGGYLQHRFGILKIAFGSPGYHLGIPKRLELRNPPKPPKELKPLYLLDFRHKKRRPWTSFHDEVVEPGGI